MPADSQVHKQVVRKRAEVRAIELDTATRLHYVEVEEPDMHRQRGDFERVEEALQAQWGLGRLTIDLGPLRELQKALRKGGWKVTVAVHKGERITACWPGFHDTLLRHRRRHRLDHDRGASVRHGDRRGRWPRRG